MTNEETICGAFSKWRGDGSAVDVAAYADWVRSWELHPAFDGAIIPDAIGVNLRDLALKPRAVALLVALRKGPRSTGSLADAIGDTLRAQTKELCRLLADGVDGYRLLAEYPPNPTGTGLSNLDLWGLTHDGLGWLQSQGLDASEDAKRQLYAATDAQAVRP